MDESKELLETLLNHFDIEELRTLCFNLNIHYDDLRGEGRVGKARELIAFCERHGRLPELIEAIKKQRPRVVLSNALMAYLPDGKTAVSEIPPATPPNKKAEPPGKAPNETIEPSENQVRDFAKKNIGKIAAVVAVMAICIALLSLLNWIQELGNPTPTTQTETLSAATNVSPIPTATPTLTFTATRTPTPTLDPSIPPPNPTLNSRWTRPTDNMVMVYVPPGTFLMGSNPEVDPDTQDDERPQHNVSLDSFWIDRTEVTNEQYKLCVQESSCDTSVYANDGRYNGDEQPVVGIDWFSAEAYCTWTGGQLPSEAQWEYAARGNDGRLYPWGNEFDGQKLNFCDSNCGSDWKDDNYNDGYAFAAPVGSYPAGESWVGAVDMAGNVWEWVADWYYNTNYHDNSPNVNSASPTGSEYKVLRGGSWVSTATFVRSARRYYNDLADRIGDFGFRCVIPGA